MEIVKTREEGLELEFKVTCSVEDLENKVNNKLLGFAKVFKMDGFRPGKVPVSIVKAKYQKEARNDVINLIVDDSFKKIKQDYDISEITSTIKEKNDVDGQPLEFSWVFEKKPLITLPDFKEINIEKPVYNISDKDKEKALGSLLKQFTKYEIQKDSVETDDKVVLNIIPYFEGKEVKDLIGKEIDIIAGDSDENLIFEKFEHDNLIGKTTGSKFTIEATVAEGVDPDYDNKSVTAEIEIVKILQPEKAEFNEELFKKLQVKDAEELEQVVTGQIKNEFAGLIRSIMTIRLFDVLDKVVIFELPKSLVEKERRVLYSNLDKFKKNDENFKNKTEQENNEYIDYLANRRVKMALIVSEYAAQNNIVVTEDEVKHELLMEMYKYRNQNVLEFYRNNSRALEALKGSIIERKAISDILEKAVTLTEHEYSSDKIEKLVEEGTKQHF